MSVSLVEVLKLAGYDVLMLDEDAEWLISKQVEFAELIEEAQAMLERKEERNGRP